MIQTCICGEAATFRAERIVPGDDPNWTYGEIQVTWWCDEHFAILAKETIFRYTFEQLETTPRRRQSVEGQSEWELPGT